MVGPIFLLHCGSQRDLHATLDEVEGPPSKRARHTDDSRYRRALQDNNLIITVIETTVVPAGKFKKGSKKGQKRPDRRTEKNLSAFEFSISLETTFQDFLEAIARAMRCRVSSIVLDELEAKLSMRGAKKAKLDSEQAWRIYSKRLIEAICQRNANVDVEVHTLAPTKRLLRCVGLQ